MRHNSHRALMSGRVFDGGEPDASHGLARQPLVILRVQPDHRATLRAHQVLARDADRETQTSGLRDDLVGGVDRARSPHFRDRLHVLDALKQLHADRRGLQSQQSIEFIDQLRPVLGSRGGMGHAVLRLKVCARQAHRCAAPIKTAGGGFVSHQTSHAAPALSTTA